MFRWLFCGLAACAAPPSATAASVDDATPPLEAQILELERQARPQKACQQGLDAVAQGQAEPNRALEDVCRLALAGLQGRQATALTARYRNVVSSPYSAQLWAAAALAGDTPAWLRLAEQFERAAGPSNAERNQDQADSLAAAQAAAQRALEAGAAGAGEMLVRLQAQDFPLHGAPQEPLWWAIYFGQFERITDTPDTRRHVAGFTLGMIEHCEGWDVRLRSGPLDAALAAYLAPLRRPWRERIREAMNPQGPSRAAAAAPARDGATDHSAASGFEQVRHRLQAMRQALSTGSADGRQAAGQWFNSAARCHSPRGQRLLDALRRYLSDLQQRAPLPPSTLAVAPLPPNRSGKD